MYAISHTFFRRCDAKGGSRKLRDLGKKKGKVAVPVRLSISREKSFFKMRKSAFSSFMREDAFVRSGTEFMLRLFFPPPMSCGLTNPEKRHLGSAGIHTIFFGMRPTAISPYFHPEEKGEGSENCKALLA